MAAGICVCCQRRASAVELQHVAGQANHWFCVPVCISCHRLLTLRQAARGVPLSRGMSFPGDPTLEALAFVDGVMDLMAVASERRPDHVTVPAALWRCGARVLHHVLFREDGFTPDPRVPTLPALPRSGTPRQGDQLQVAAHLFAMMRILAELLPGTPVVWRELAARGEMLDLATLDEVVKAVVDPESFDRLAADLNDVNGDLIALVLAADPTDPRLAERLQAWAGLQRQAEEMAQRVLDAVDRAA